MDLFSLTKESSLVTQAEDVIKEMFPKLLKLISYDIKTGLPYAFLKQHDTETHNVAGAYDHKTNTLYISAKATVNDCIHEIGHCIHYQVLGCKEFPLPLDGKTEYAHVNFKEDFAEAFTDLCSKGNVITDRDREMFDILNSVTKV
ncbi:hypothetical protein JOC34_002834 [Virgibacillus halotolerans]|uniref:hypothetical protein n=1 Tax=Virgibacillus halotolerans TaxID=1071053 RepID=UPI001961AD54|nr:hypothetical protein [Virgibacillus halotolerans]MBM7600443.1 hypothetical protein [Virgibacillus halotolerans]